MPNDQIHRFFLLTVLLALFASLPLCAQNTFSGNPVRYKSACAEQMERFYALTVECLLDYDAQLEQNIKETYLTTDHVLHPDFYGKRSKNALFSYENYVAELKKSYANHLEEDEEFDVQVHDLDVRGASHPAENSEALYVEVEYTTQVLSGSRSLYRGKTQAVLYFPSLYNTLECTIKQIIPADEWTVADNKQPTVKTTQGKAKSQELSPAELLKLGYDYHYGRNGKEKSYEKAVEYYFQAAELGDAEAQHRLGTLYYDGQCGLSQSYEKASEWWMKSAEQGFASAQYNLGHLYFKGLGGLPQSYDKASEWWMKSAEQGFVIAQYNLGLLYCDGLGGLSQSYEKALEWWMKSAEQGFASAQYNLGLSYAGGLGGLPQSYEKAVEWYTKAAEQGHADAQYHLGICYAEGQGVPQSYDKTVEWYIKSAEQGHVGAYFGLGICYTNGQGVPQSHEKAVEWYGKAAEQGHILAQCNLGVCYELGQGVPQSYEKAVEWYTKAAEQDVYAQYNLGVCYEKGQGVPKSVSKALEWYRKADANGHPEAKKRIAELEKPAPSTSSTRNTGSNFSTNQKLSNIGVSQLTPSELNKLGEDFYYGRNGRVKSYADAAKLYRQAAEQGNADAQYNLGFCYEFGQGVPKSGENAMKWYREAATRGHSAAKNKLPSTSTSFFSDTFILHGTVVDKRDGLPVIGCTVERREKLTSKKFIGGAVTDVNGKFSLEVKTGDVLIFEYVGMETCSYVIPTQDKVKSGIKVVMKGNK